MKYCILTFALIPLLASGAEAPKDSCFDCHKVMEGTSDVFKDDVHYHNTISCVDCHGGDPKEDTANVSMSPDRGFKVRVTRQGTPEFCGSCHSEAAYMGKFSPQMRVDQLALYRGSVHGKQLAAGRKGAAECVDCHSIHNIRAGSDPLSPASPQHVTDTCSKCHTAAADLFRKSPHSRFNSERRPGCTVCHASHATEPAGTAMLAGGTSVCVRCHNATSAGGKAAAQIAQYLAGLEAAGPASSQALARARLAVHSFNLAAIKQAAETPAPATNAVPKAP